MSEPSGVNASAENRARWGRWSALFFVLLLEFQVITLGVEGQVVASARGGLWSGLFNFEGSGRVAFLGAISLLVLTRPSSVETVRLRAAVERWFLLAHGASFALFLLLTHWMLGKPEAPPGSALVWIAAWASAGALSVLLLWFGLVGVPRIRRWATVLWVLPMCVGMAWAIREIGYYSSGFWRPFSNAALGLSALLLKGCFSNVVVDAPELVLGLDDFAVRVESGCSGLEGLAMSTVLGLAYLFVFRRQLRFPQAFGLVALGMAFTWLGNGVRLAAMVWIGARVNPELALGGFHSKAGWVLFSTVALGMAFVGHHSRFFARPVETLPAGAEARSATAAFLMPLMALLAIALVLGMFGRTGGPWYALRMLVGVAVLAWFWRDYHDLRWLEPGALRACLLGCAVGCVWLASGALFPTGEPVEPSQPGFGWLLLRALGFVTIVPLAEELAFRGYLLRALQSRDFAGVSYRTGAWWAIAISSIVFGALHDRWILATIAGLCYALVQISGGRLRDAVLAHASTNATLAAFALLTRNPAFFV